MTGRHPWSFRTPIAILFACAAIADPRPALPAPVQTCTVLNVRGVPIAGVVCGGSSHALFCSAGALYNCRSGVLGQTNNCTLAQACAIGCFTGPTTVTLSDACFFGSRPLTASTTRTLGGNDVGFTVTLAAGHPSGAIVNLEVDRGDLMPGASCGAPSMPAGTTSASFALPTATVASSTPVSIFTDIAYADPSGASRQLVSVPAVVTLDPGGTEPPPPPLASFTLTPSTIRPGQYSFMDVVLSRMAPARGVAITVASANPSVASVVPNGQPTILGGCTTGGGAATIQASASVPTQTTVAISASSGAAGQAPLTRPLTVTGGCSPRTCLQAGAGSLNGTCGPLPDGCGGTITCGCDFGGQVCGGSGTPGVCGTPPLLAVSALSLAPASVTSGGSSTGTVTLSMAAPPGGAAVFLLSSGAAASVPPSVVVAAGQTSASFPITTSTVAATTLVTITASLAGTATAVLTVNPAATRCTPTTCAAQGKNCGSIANGCGGTLVCGSCTAPQTCGGAGVPNVCGGGSTSTVPLTVTATGRSDESVSSSPAGLEVNVGSTGTASFATGTQITLTVSDGRDAFWTGGCTTADKTNSCRLTLNAATSVTANVQ